MRISLHPAVVGSNAQSMGAYCRYLGVQDLLYQLHDVNGYQDGALTNLEALYKLQQQYGEYGLRFSAVNDFLPDGVEALDRRREGLLSALPLLAKAEIETLILFALQQESEETVRALEAFYKAIVPKACELGLRIATHGHWCEGHVVWNHETTERLLAFDTGPSNGICLCVGCCYQAGEDPLAMIREMPERIHAVHIRDTALRNSADLEEIPLGTGSVPIAGAIGALADTGYEGVIIPEHLGCPRIARCAELAMSHAVGYVQGIMHSRSAILREGHRGKSYEMEE